MTTRTITKWSAKRSGSSITVSGKDEAGVDVRITDVNEITRIDVAGGPATVAILHGAGHVILD